MALEGKQFGHYRILQLVGRGSMGEVYLIEDSQVQRRIAAKIIRIETVQSDQEAAINVLRLFWREATAIARLDHPCILPLYDHGEAMIDGSHIAYLTMPYRPEGSMTNWLRQRANNRQTRQLTMKQAAHVIQQAGNALQYAHDHQVMHLDVKPANFLIRSRAQMDEYPDLLLSDFGIARLVSAASRESQQVRGTPIYMAPEQWASHPVFASDQYALAIMAYELLTGNPPFQGTPLSVMFAHIHHKPLPVHTLNPLLPPTVDLVLQRALAKEPEERFPSVAAFSQAFYNAFPSIPGERALRVLRLLPAPATSPVANTPIPTQDVLYELPPAQRRALHLTASASDSSQTSQALPPPQTPLSSQEMALLQSTTSIHTTILPRISVIPSTDAPSRASSSDQRFITLPPLPISQRAIHLRPSSIAVIVTCFIVLLLGTGSLGAYGAVTGHWPWYTSSKVITAAHEYATATIPANPGQSWHQQAGAPQKLGNIAWLGSLFIAMGNNGTIFTSPNGSIWTPRHSGATHLLEGIAQSSSLFVIVGDRGTILTSPDGIVWTLRHSGTSQNLYDVAWSGSLFLAVGDNGTVLTSRNGITWTSKVISGFPSFYGITWSGSLFVAVNDGGILISSDGNTWTHPPSSTQQVFDGIVWSGSLFIVVGTSGTIFTSRNGITWTPQRSNITQDLYNIDWSGSLFVATGQNGTILTSRNGIDWTHQHSGTSQNIVGVACSNFRFVALESNGILTSP